MSKRRIDEEDGSTVWLGGCELREKIVKTTKGERPPFMGSSLIEWIVSEGMTSLTITRETGH
jgi:hypothetical protein